MTELFHPGKVLLDQFINGRKVSESRVAAAIGVSPDQLDEVIQGKQPISEEIAHGLGKYFDLSPQYWLNLQEDFDDMNGLRT